MSFFTNNRYPPSQNNLAVRRDEQPAERRYTLLHTDWDAEEEWQEDEDGCEYIEPHNVVELWKAIERHRRHIADLEARFQRWMRLSPALAKHWQQFTDAGGVTAEDFDKFCQGKMRHKSLRGKKHLRLVSTKRNVVRRTRLNQTGNDAA